MAQETFGKALITAGKAQRFVTSQINVQTNVQEISRPIITKEDALKAYLEIIKG